MPTIPGLQRLRQEDWEFEVSLVYAMIPVLKTTISKNELNLRRSDGRLQLFISTLAKKKIAPLVNSIIVYFCNSRT